MFLEVLITLALVQVAQGGCCFPTKWEGITDVTAGYHQGNKFGFLKANQSYSCDITKKKISIDQNITVDGTNYHSHVIQDFAAVTSFQCVSPLKTDLNYEKYHTKKDHRAISIAACISLPGRFFEDGFVKVNCKAFLGEIKQIIYKPEIEFLRDYLLRVQVNKKKQYIILNTTCQVSNLGLSLVQFIPDNATILSKSYFGASDAKLQIISYMYRKNETNFTLTTTKTGCFPIWLQSNGPLSGNNMMLTVGYKGITIGVKNESVFDIPPSCRIRTARSVKLPEIYQRVPSPIL